MSLKPYLVGWVLLVLAALAFRLSGAGAGLGVSAAYGGAATLLVVHGLLRYRLRLSRFLKREHRDVWQSLGNSGGLVRWPQLLGWLLAPDRVKEGDLHDARVTGRWIGVMLGAWLISTPAVALLLAIRIH